MKGNPPTGAAMTVRFDLANAPTVVRELVAQVREGNEVEFCDGEKVVAKLTPLEQSRPSGGSRRSLRGLYQGKIEMSDDFAAPLKDDELKELGL
jgi:antitoxin (DNA-binding transcriptional repressor) of toxin-antitoxin stability system